MLLHLSKQFQSILWQRPLSSVVIDSAFFCLGLTAILLSWLLSSLVWIKVLGTLIGAGCFVFAFIITADWFFEYRRMLSFTHVNKEEHVYIESVSKVCGQPVAKLVYYDHLPVLFLNTTDPREKGIHIAKHTGSAFLELWDRYIQFLPYAMRASTGKVFSQPLSFIKAEIHRLQLQFPDFIVEEMEGFLEEIGRHVNKENQWLWFKRKPITLEDFKALYCFGDIYKALGACGAAVRNTPDRKELMRNLDWFSMGVLGKTTYMKVAPVRHPTETGPKKVLSITFPPGLLGLSMANDCGFIVVLNEATTMETKRNHLGGWPQFLLLREMAEHCKTVEEAIDFVKHHPPAASHLLTVMDKTGDGAILQMLPTGSDDLFTVRRMENHFVHTTNHFYDQDNRIIPGSQAIPSSERRYDLMEKALRENKSARDVLQAANCRFTVHSMIFTYLQNDISLSLNFDESYAGDQKNTFTKLSLLDLFSSRQLNQ